MDTATLVLPDSPVEILDAEPVTDLTKPWSRTLFVSGEEAINLYHRLLTETPWHKEPHDGPTAMAAHYGKSYTHDGGKVEYEIPEMHAFVRTIAANRIEVETGHRVNYVQLHNYGPDDFVPAHYDPAGMIVAMLVLGQERTFTVNSEPVVLRHGDLLVFNGGKVWHHMAPADQDPNFNAHGFDRRVTVLFRYTTDEMREKGTAHVNKKRQREQYAAASLSKPTASFDVQQEAPTGTTEISNLDISDRTALIQRLKQLHTNAKQAYALRDEQRREAGRILLTLRKATPHGDWEPQLKNICAAIGMSRSTAHNYMNAAEKGSVPKPERRNCLPTEAVKAITAFIDKTIREMPGEDTLQVYQQLSEELRTRISVERAA